MFFRVILAALLGGAAVLFVGYFEHNHLLWGERTMSAVADPATVTADMPKHFPKPGFYVFPPMPADMHKMTREEKDAAQKKWEDETAKDSSGFVIIRPTGGDAKLNMKQRIMYEGGSNVLAALCVAVVISLTRPNVGFLGRWMACIVLGVFAWLSINASNFIWFGYPWAFVQDELLCSLFEWAVAGFFIALIVRPKEQMLGY